MSAVSQGCNDRQTRSAMYEIYVKRLREDDINQLYRFSKMHLSFVLDLNSEKFDALLGEKEEQSTKIGLLLQKIKSGSRSDSSLLEEQCKYISTIVNCIEILTGYLNTSENLQHEGLFRKCGNVTRQKDLKERLQSGRTVDFTLGYYTAHDCAAVLKSLLADLPEPLFTERLCNAHMSVLDIEEEERRIKALSLLVQMLPSERFKIAKQLFALLHKVTLHADSNKMPADNLGAIFAPHILCSKKMTSSELQSKAAAMQSAVSFIIQHCRAVFTVPEMLALDVYNYLKSNNISCSSSDESMMSFGSFDASICRSASENSKKCSDDNLDVPINTVVTFTERRAAASTNDTAVELAKLYAHVQAMPESTKKRKLMKQFNEANGYSQQVEAKRKHTRSHSFGETIKRRFSRRRRKSVNINIENQVIKNDMVEDSNVVNTSYLLSNNSSSDEPLAIATLSESPFPRRRHLTTHLGAASKSESHKAENVGCCSTDTNTLTVPTIRKRLLPTDINGTPDNKPIKLKSVKDCPCTPPGPKRAMIIFDADIHV